ncbi:MAG: ABATE domain-containing protein [Burkholderiaceae bacterium]
MTTSSNFPLLGEPLALDLVNTCVRRDGAAVDLLDTPAALSAWLKAQSARLAWSGAAADADLHAVRELRTAVAALLDARRAGSRPPASALRKVNAALAAPVASARLTWNAAGPRLAGPAEASRRQVLLHALAADLVSLLTGPSALQLRVCAHPECVLQFVAVNPRRRWCSAAACGNRARVARHYLRQQAQR